MIVVAAAEAAVGLAIVILIARNRQSLNVERVNLLKDSECHVVLDHLWIIPLLPLLGAAANGIFWRRAGRTSVVNRRRAWLDGACFRCGARSCARIFALPADQHSLGHNYFHLDLPPADSARTSRCKWISSPWSCCWSSPASASLIHIYSTGYMAHEGGYGRFFSYLNLFMFFMLIAGARRELRVMFVGWEGVGLCSYLLIGFWFLKKSATDAGNKAFWVNRVGDFGFLLGMFLMFRTFGSLDFSSVFCRARPRMPAEPPGHFGTLTGIALAAVHGRVRKIRADSSVCLAAGRDGRPHAGQRADPRGDDGHRGRLYGRALARDFPACAGRDGRSSASSAAPPRFSPRPSAWCRPTSRKFSPIPPSASSATCSWPAASARSAAGIFHLMTHAFFKALLFLAAGSVIHAMGGEQDMRKMGGLRKKIPVTYWTMLIATLAIAGVPGFSGFFSKDEILSARIPSPYGGKFFGRWACSPRCSPRSTCSG